MSTTPAETWRLDGRTCLITGATAGIGRQAALSLARLGADLVLVGRGASAWRGWSVARRLWTVSQKLTMLQQ